MKNMKNFFLSLCAVAVLGFTTGCSDDGADGPEPVVPGEELSKSGVLAENETWTANNIYILDGKVVVDDGVTLTIEPGTIIKGAKGQEASASALVVDQGGKLIANGTAESPIIFTSVDDNIEPGQKAGTNLDETANGLWGGVIILGKAPISVGNDAGVAQIEGIPATESYGQYGGEIANDNSGSLKFVSIRHGGITIGQDNEINGLTLGGVGSGTVIQNIEIVANQDDGIEWFGGTVNSSNLLTWGHGDDGLDVDQEYTGTISNAVVIQGDEPGSAFELDGPEGTTNGTPFIMKDITVFGNGKDALVADLRDGVLVEFENILVLNPGASSSVNINGEDSQNELLSDRIVFSNWELLLPNGLTVADFFTGATEGGASKFTDNAIAIESADAASVGANLADFSWTYAAEKGALN